ncbi:MAG: hypothetical protein QXU18_09960 [Thermoplasmatales archaeon]
MEASTHVRSTLWIEALALGEQIGPLHNRRLDNNWPKRFLSIAIFGLLLGVLEVPVYRLVESAGSSPISFNFVIENTQMKAFSSLGTTGDLIDYELNHWKVKRSVVLLGDIIFDAFSDVSLETAFYFALAGAGIEDAAGAILAADGLLSDSDIVPSLLAFMSSPVGWGVMIFIGSAIVGF